MKLIAINEQGWLYLLEVECEPVTPLSGFQNGISVEIYKCQVHFQLTNCLH